jgi:hypothetical protein
MFSYFLTIFLFLSEPIKAIQIENVIEGLTKNKKIEKYYTQNIVDDMKTILMKYGGEIKGIKPKSVLILACLESSFNPKAFNRNNNGTNDGGFLQQNSKYWTGRYLEAKKDFCKLKQFKNICYKIKNDRYDLLSNLITSIHHLGELKRIYKLTNQKSIMLAHHGIGYVTNPKKYNTNRNKYLKALSTNEKLINRFWK